MEREKHPLDARTERQQRRVARQNRQFLKAMDQKHKDLPLPGLPLSLVQENIMAFIAPIPDMVAITVPSPTSYRRDLAILECVSHSWFVFVRNRVEQQKKRHCCVVFKDGSKQESKELLRRVALAGRDAVLLRIKVEDRGDVLDFTTEMIRTAPLLSKLSWQPIFSAVPNLVRLDLFDSCMSLVGRILPVAATVCPHIQVLITPHHQTTLSPRVGHELTSVLIDAMCLWHASNGGLRGLFLRTWPEAPHSRYDDLLAAVAAYCPRIAYLHGGYGDGGGWMGTKLGVVSDSVWASFCMNCTEIRDFYWTMAPLTAFSIEQFRQKTKPHLQRLVVSDISRGKQDLPPLDTIQSMLIALPHLVHLSIDLEDDLHRHFYRGVPSQPALSGSLDALAHQVVLHCPQLETFRCTIRRPYDTEVVMTDAGVTALASCRSLKTIDIHDVVRVVDGGLIAMLQSMITIANGSRPQSRHVEFFQRKLPHKAILQFLWFLDQVDPSDLAKIQLEMYILLGCSSYEKLFDDVIEEREMPTNGQLVALYDSIKMRHSKMITYLSVAVSSHKGQNGDETRHQVSGMYLRINKARNSRVPDEAEDGIRYEIHGQATVSLLDMRSRR